MNWKTTLSGIVFVGSLCGFLATITDMMPGLIAYKGYLLGVSAVAGFINAYFQKDKDMSGGTKMH